VTRCLTQACVRLKREVADRPAALDKQGLQSVNARPVWSPATIMTMTQEDAIGLEAGNECVQRCATLAWWEQLQHAALDDHVKLAGTHCRIKDVAQHKANLPARPLQFQREEHLQLLRAEFTHLGELPGDDGGV
jgi:hypothetical protein